MGLSLLRYKVGDYVYIREDLKHNKVYGDFQAKDICSLRGEKLKVTYVSELTESYSLRRKGYGVGVNDLMLDHFKTRNLPENHFKRKEERFN